MMCRHMNAPNAASLLWHIQSHHGYVSLDLVLPAH